MKTTFQTSNSVEMISDLRGCRQLPSLLLRDDQRRETRQRAHRKTDQPESELEDRELFRRLELQLRRRLHFQDRGPVGIGR